MKAAILNSRSIGVINLEDYIPQVTTEIISGGTREIDTHAREYIQTHNLKLVEFLPEYSKYCRLLL